MKITDIPPARLDALHRGAPCTTLVEALALDHRLLARAISPPLSDCALDALDAARAQGITKRMQIAGRAITLDRGWEGACDLLGHSSDTIRGWACYALAAESSGALTELFERLRAPATDDHFAVREWAWLAARPHIARDVDGALGALASWAHDPHEYARRFASEATRPRGVWCAHLPALKEAPEQALPLLEPMRSDPSRYVQDSVANWLNDASKTRPDWVREVCARWREESDTPETARTCQRAMRSLPR